MALDTPSWASSLYSQLNLLQSRTFEDSMYMSNTENKNKTVDNSSEAPAIAMSMSDSALDKVAAATKSGSAPAAIRTRQGPGLKVLFLSSDTGGGHRASAESLGKQFQILFPGTTFDLLDVVEKDGVPPYNSLVSAYKHLSNRPSQWKLVYNVSNSRAFEVLADAHLKLMCEKAVRRRIQSYDPDVVVSVHPLMTNVPVLSCSKISKKTGRHLPIFTVVTDLGSAHCLWFDNGVEKMFVGSETVKQLAKARGKVPEEKLVLAGLPIRHDFAVQAELLGDRFSSEGKAYQRKIRKELNLPPIVEQSNSLLSDSVEEINVDRPTLLLMGGGEGVGSLENITDALYVELTSKGIDALILVVCGRNEKLQSWIEKRHWAEVYDRWMAARRKEEMKAKGVLSKMSVDGACTKGVPFSGISFGSGCIETADVTTKIRKMLKYTAGTVSGVAKGPLSPSATNSNCGTGEIVSAATEVAGEVLAHLTHSDLSEEKKSDDGEILETAKLSGQAEIDAGRVVDATSSAEEVSTDEPASQLSADPITASATTENHHSNVTVVGLGFVTQMAEYMVATDILITKAGPGTIAEAASLSLPVLLTSFLPGQEEGNVDFVVDGGFGVFRPVSDPIAIAEEVSSWLQDEDKMRTMGHNAKLKGTPYAARDIARSIGESTLRWIEHNQQVAEEREFTSISKTLSWDGSASTKE